MIFTLSWLKEYVDFDMSPEELAHSLTMGGLEVEAVEYMGKGLENIVTAQILDIRPHPDASKLVLCDVTDGERNYDIVCGATNMKAGDKVALAKIGAPSRGSRRALLGRQGLNEIPGCASIIGQCLAQATRVY